MRIFRLVVALLVVLAVMFPLITLASESSNTETKTNKYLNAISNFFFPSTAKADETVEIVVEPEVIEEPVKTEEELKNEKILDRWKAKQTAKWANLPQEEFVINASAYTAAADECGWNTGITASGIMVEEKRTLACPPEYPFGTIVEIEGMGQFRCEDRGGAIKGNHFDIYMETKAEAFKFGRRNLLAHVVQ